MRNYIDLSNYYPDNISFGNYEIKKLQNDVIVAQNILDFYSNQSPIDTSEFYHTLLNNLGICVMETTDIEKLTNKYFLDNATGDIIVFGIGLGLIIYPLLDDPTITSIKIIEIDNDIITYIGGIIKEQDINNKVTIVQGDAMTYYQNVTNETYDFIYFDYWNHLTVDSFNEMDQHLINYQSFKKNGDSIILSWCQDIKHLILGL